MNLLSPMRLSPGQTISAAAVYSPDTDLLDLLYSSLRPPDTKPCHDVEDSRYHICVLWMHML